MLAVGPEGGWSAFELNLFREQGFAPFSFGKPNFAHGYRLRGSAGNGRHKTACLHLSTVGPILRSGLADLLSQTLYLRELL